MLERVERGQLRLSRELVERIARAFGAIVEYLDEVLLGEPQQPLYLFPCYRELLEARGAERVHPADLFVVPVAAQLVVADAQTRALDAAELLAARAQFERGLLQVLRNPDDAAGIAALHQAIDTVAGSQVGARHPTFWKVALAWFEALRDGAIALDVYGKRLLARMNLQLRRAIADLLALLDADLDRIGLDLLAPRPGEHPGDLARPRMLEVAAALNRLRTLRVRVP